MHIQHLSGDDRVTRAVSICIGKLKLLKRDFLHPLIIHCKPDWQFSLASYIDNTLVSSINYRKEIDTLRSITFNKSYKLNVIDRIFKQNKMRQLRNMLSDARTGVKYSGINHIKNISGRIKNKYQNSRGE